MDRLTLLLLWTALAGACIPIGALLARIEHIRPQWLEDELRHFVIAFGGGVLVGAVALVLVPKGIERLPHPLAAVAVLITGGILYLTFEDIAPQARLERHWAPPIGAVCGFALALLGEMLL